MPSPADPLAALERIEHIARSSTAPDWRDLAPLVETIRAALQPATDEEVVGAERALAGTLTARARVTEFTETLERFNVLINHRRALERKLAEATALPSDEDVAKMLDYPHDELKRLYLHALRQLRDDAREDEEWDRLRARVERLESALREIRDAAGKRIGFVGQREIARDALAQLTEDADA